MRYLFLLTNLYRPLSVLFLFKAMAGQQQASSSFNGWLQRVRKTGEYSDITVVVEGEEFRLHMLPLSNASSYFRSLPKLPSRLCVSGSTRKIELHDMPGGAKAFSMAADFCHLIKPSFSLHNIAHIRAVAQFLGMAELLESTKKYLYFNVFSHWRSSMGFLHQYTRLQSPVDEYIESRCLKVIISAATKAFFDTKHLSPPISLPVNTWQSSPCQILTEILVRMASLPSPFVSMVVEELVMAEINLNLKCRQGRTVKGWLDYIINVECKTDAARCWVVVCLVSMLQKSVLPDRPWLELSSQYWCCLLEHAAALMKVAAPEIVNKMKEVNSFLLHRIGGSLHELDDYLTTYKFDPQAIICLVKKFKEVEGVSEKEMEEVATEVDSCLWNFVDPASVSTKDLIFLIKAFPSSARKSHDMLYTAIHRMEKRGSLSSEDEQNLWSLVDITKLSPAYRDDALKNSAFLCQPRVLEYVLQLHSQELGALGNGNKQNLHEIMQRVIRASLKLLEENSRRSKEISQLQKQYAAVMGNGMRNSYKSSLDLFKPVGSLTMVQDEVEDRLTETPRRSTCSSVEY